MSSTLPTIVITQADRILARLALTPGQWVPMPELASVSGAYAVHSRIADLRAAGHAIEVKIEGTRPRCSYYRLTSPVQTRMPFAR
jgi:hypothetical protein